MPLLAGSAVAACTWPNAPNSTFVNERFIARHMMIDRIRPLEPSSAPAVISSLLSSTKPIATADSPAYEFRIEITVGMSAPPIGMISSTPNASASTMISGETRSPTSRGRVRDEQQPPSSDGQRQQPEVAEVLIRIRHRPLRNPLTSCSLPAAIRLPVSVRKPRMTSTTIAIIRKVVSCRVPSPSHR